MFMKVLPSNEPLNRLASQVTRNNMNTEQLGFREVIKALVEKKGI
jgi:hypothetical protein